MEKKKSPIVPIVLAVVIGLLTMLLLNGLIRPKSIVVAKIAIAPGTILSADLLEVRSVPAGGRPSDAFESIAEVEGKMLAVQRAAGDFITAAVLGENSSAGIPAQLQPDHVAIAVHVDLSSGVAGMLRAGQTVTVIGLLTPDVVTSQPGLATVIQSAPIVLTDGEQRQPTATPTVAPPLGPLGRISISGIRILMVPQSFQYQEIPQTADQEEMFASAAATSSDEGAIVLDVPTTPVEIAPGVLVNPATLIAALDRFGGVYLALESSSGLAVENNDILTLNLASLYKTIIGNNEGAPAATPTMVRSVPTSEPTPEPSATAQP